MTTINVDEWVSELNRLAEAQHSAEGMTTAELAEAAGVGEQKIRKMLKKAIACGEWEYVLVWRNTIIGTPQRYPGYRPVKK